MSVELLETARSAFPSPLKSPGHQSGRGGVGGERAARLEGAVAIVQEDAHRAGGGVDPGEVEVAVAVEVGNGDAGGAAAQGIAGCREERKEGPVFQGLDDRPEGVPVPSRRRLAWPPG